jgi:hypothetical protein
MLTNQIREDVKNAVLAGLFDALVELQTGAADHQGAADAFRARMAARQLPAHANGHGGGLDLLAEAKASGIDLPAGGNGGNGRGRNKRAE